MCEPDPLCFFSFCLIMISFWTFNILLLYVYIYHLLSCRYLFVVCAFCYFFFLLLFCPLMLPCPLPPLTSPLLWEGRRWGGGGGCGGDVPPCPRVRLEALHGRAAIPPPAYRGASKPQKMHTEKPKAGRKRFHPLGWAAKAKMGTISVLRTAPLRCDLQLKYDV